MSLHATGLTSTTVLSRPPFNSIRRLATFVIETKSLNLALRLQAIKDSHCLAACLRWTMFQMEILHQHLIVLRRFLAVDSNIQDRLSWQLLRPNGKPFQQRMTTESPMIV